MTDAGALKQEGKEAKIEREYIIQSKRRQKKNKAMRENNKLTGVKKGEGAELDYIY